MLKVYVRSCVGLALLGASSAFAQYTPVSLHPVGFVGSDGAKANGGIQVGRAFDFNASPFVQHAVMWSGSSGSYVDLHPAAATNGYSSAMGAWGNQVGGFVSGDNTGGQGHAWLWDIVAATGNDLHPAGFDNSQINGVHGTTQVGQATASGVTHAGMWSGTVGSFVDLHPTGASYSVASAASDTTQGGLAQFGSVFEAALWSGSSASFVSLHPTSGFDGSQVNAIDGSLQGGSGYGVDTGFESHALLWSGTAASVQDLNPAGYSSSRIIDMANGVQVGFATMGSSHAFLWRGSATDTLDLHQFLSADYTNSLAEGIDAATGDIVGQAYNATLDRYETMLWKANPVPEPASLFALAAGAAALLRRRKTSR